MHAVTIVMHTDSPIISVGPESTKKAADLVNVHDISGITVNENGKIVDYYTNHATQRTGLNDYEAKTDMAKTVEFLEWALAMIDANFKETGQIEFAEVIVYKAAKAHLLKIKEDLK